MLNVDGFKIEMHWGNWPTQNPNNSNPILKLKTNKGSGQKDPADPQQKITNINPKPQL